MRSSLSGDADALKEAAFPAEYGWMATVAQPERMFDVALSPDDGRIRITRSDTRRVALALSPEEASQIRAGLKGALQPNAKKLKKRNKRKSSKRLR
jgi:hypothetical protein